MKQDVALPTDVHPERRAAGEPLPALTALARALLLLAAEGFSIGLGLAFLTFGGALPEYMTANTLSPAGRRTLLLDGVCGVGVLVVSALAIAIVQRRRSAIPRTCLRVARRLGPTGVVGFLPLLLERNAWGEKLELAFLSLTLVAIVCLELGLVTWLDEGPVIAVLRVTRWMRDRVERAVERRPWLANIVPIFVVFVAAAVFSVSVALLSSGMGPTGRSSPITKIESTFLRNLIHGGSLLAAPGAPALERHLSPFAFLLALAHAAAPHPGTLIVIQSALLGFTAVPLYLLARLRLSRASSAVLALAYLGYGPLLGSAVEGFHYISLSGFFLLWALYALDTSRHVLAAVAILLTLSVHEDAALLLACGGAFLLVSGRRPVAATIAAVVGSAYFALAKGLMLAHAGSPGTSALAHGLVPAGESGFSGIVAAILGNPWFTTSKLDEAPKLAYLLEIFVPLALSPLRSGKAVLLLVPGVLFTLLYSAYPAAISIRSHFVAYWTPLVFVGTIHVLSKGDARSRRALLGAIVLATFICAAHSDAFMRTAWGGKVP